MITQKVLYDKQVGKDELVRFYADIFWSKSLSIRSLSYNSRDGGGFVECDPSPEDVSRRIREISGHVKMCEMERTFLGYLGPTTRVAFKNTDSGGCEVIIVGSYCNLKDMRQDLDQIMGAPSNILYRHIYDVSFDTRINSYFGGRVKGKEWGQKLKQLDELTATLTGIPFLTEQDFEVYRRTMHFQHDLDFQPFAKGDGKVKISAAGSFFESCQEIPNNSIGYGIELILIGTKEGVKIGLSTSVAHLGYPLRVEVPLLPIPFLDSLLASMNEDHSQTTNIRGWRTAKEVIRESAAKLSAKVDINNSYRFQYNLLWDLEGKVVKDGKVLDPDWGRNALECIVARGQVSSVTIRD